MTNENNVNKDSEHHHPSCDIFFQHMQLPKTDYILLIYYNYLYKTIT
jgi:hypothetical protein